MCVGVSGEGVGSESKGVSGEGMWMVSVWVVWVCGW